MSKLKSKFVRLALIAATGVFVLGGCGLGGLGGGFGSLIPFGIGALLLSSLLGTPAT